MTDYADEAGAVGEDVRIQDTVEKDPSTQVKESMLSDDAGDSSDSDAFHIDLKSETPTRQNSTTEESESEPMLGEIQGPISPIDNQDDDDSDLDSDSLEKLDPSMENDDKVSIQSEDSNLFGDSYCALSPSSGHSNKDSSQHMPSPAKLSRKEFSKIEAVTTGTGDKKYVCPICNLQLDNLHNLTMHIRNHNSKVPSSHTCTICGKVLCSQSSLDRHMLVHSGERPFKCQICNLAFTTNGNMHRHMRVHEKEFAKSPQALKEMLDAGLLNAYSVQGRRFRKRRQTTDGNAEGGKRRSIDGAASKTSDEEEKPVYAALRKKLGVANGDDSSPSKDQEDEEDEEVFEAENEDGSGDENPEGEQLHCPVCNRAFLCKYGLQSHLESHPEYTIECSLCNISFRNLRGLNMHNLMVHSRKGDEKKNGLKSSVPVGFHDLGFVDFSVEKFPLIAKSWCEHNTRRSSSSYHNFECRKCQKAFPCGGALKLHKDSHTPETTATCEVCGCDFENNTALKEHQLSHTADRILSTGTPGTPEKDSDDDSNVSKEDFLAMLSLQGRDSEDNDSENEEMEKLDAKLNQDYFCKIGQIDRLPDKSSKHVKSVVKQTADQEENNNSNDFADIQKIIQTANGGSLTTALAAGPVTPTDNRPFLQDMPKLHHISQMMAAAGKLEGQPPPSLQLMGHYKHEPIDPELLTVPLDDTGSSDQDESTDDQNKQNFTCKYCDTGFETFNAMKVHMRTHLGLSPYKCNMCSYSSADKTTLIRHLRTHNGERPFQCRICDFAFTTKANCERHARKKHKLESKEDIDAAVGYNQFVQEGVTKPEGDFHSPDTVCKYCGIDFKFFRALKHHLRSHSSCPQKPFVCKLCSIGFSTKANCIRHVQKRHPSIEQNKIEKNIRTNIPLAHSSVQSLSPGLDESFPKIPGMSFPGMLPAPLMHSTPPPAHAGRPARPVNLFMGALGAKTGLEYLLRGKQDVPAPDLDSPLDFSKTAVKEEAPEEVLNLAKTMPSTAERNSQEEPMDLSKPGKKPGEVLPELAARTSALLDLKSGELAHSLEMMSPIMSQAIVDPLSIGQPGTSPFNFRTYKCPYCQVQFSQEAKLYLHMKTHTTNRPFQCSFCPAGFTIKTNLDIHVRTRHLNDSGALSSALRNRFIPPTLKMIAKRRESGGIGPHSYLKPKFTSFNKPADKKSDKAQDVSLHINSSGSGSDSNSELASVTKILNTTSADRFQVFLNPAETGGEETPIPIKVTRVKREEPVSPNGDSVSPGSQGTKSSLDSSGTDPNSPDKPLAKKKRNSYANAPNRVSCPYCSRTFPWISSLRRHILTHTGQKPYKCPECAVHFSTKSNRERHLLRKHGLNPNNPHTRQIMDRPYKCQLCVFSSFSKPEKLIMHYKSKHPDTDPPANVQNIASLERWDHSPDNSCEPILMPTFNSGDGEALDSEEDMEVEEKDVMEDGIVKDGVMKEESDATELGEEDEEEDEVKIIKDDNDNESLLPPPKDEKIDQLTDRELIAQRIIRQQQQQQLQQMTLSASNSPLPMIPVSPIRSVSPHTTPSPHPSPNSRIVINPERDNYNVDKILDCWQCGLHFATRKMLLRHLKEHNIDYPYKCYLCDASFMTRRECLDHKVQKHAEDWVGLKARNKIDDIPDFVEVMERLAETEDKPEEVKRDGDDPHVATVERKVFCALCPKKFWSLQDLRRHMRSHTGEKPFECDICGRYFTLKHSMMRHRRKHQDGDLIRPPRSSPFVGDMYKQDFSFNESTDDRRSMGTPDTDPYMSYGKDGFYTPPIRAAIPTPPAGPIPTPVTTETKPPSKPRSEGHAMTPLGGMGDLLGNLLGVDNRALDQMLDSAKSAAAMLGMGK